MGLDRRETLQVAVPAAETRRARHGRFRAPGDIDLAVRPEGHGRGLIRRPGAAPLGPELLAASVKDGDETVGQIRIGDPGARLKRADDRSGHGHPSVIGNGDRIAAGLIGRAEKPCRHEATHRIELHQGHVALALDRLFAGRGLDIGDHPERSVRRDSAGPDRLDTLRQDRLGDPSRHPARLRDGFEGFRRHAAVALEFQEFAPAGVARSLNHIDGVRSLRGGEPHLFGARSLHHQRPLVGPGRQGDGLGAELDGAGLAGDVFPAEPRGDAGVCQPAVDVGDDIIQRAHLTPHVGEVDRHRGVAADGPDGDLERYVALEGRDRRGQGAVMNSAGDGACGVERHRCGRLCGRGRDALNHADVLEAGGPQVVADFREPGVESFPDLGSLRRSDAPFAGPAGKRVQRAEALVESEQLSIVG